MAWKPDYITLQQGKDYLRDTEAVTVDDVELAVWVTAASRAVDEAMRRQFGLYVTAATRIYRRRAFYDPDLCLWCVEIDDVMDTTGMTVGGVALASSGAVLLPDNALADGRPYERLGFTTCPARPLPVLAKFGWLTVPTQVPGATRLQLSRFWARRDSPYGIAGSPAQGSEVRLAARLDPDVATSLRGLGRLDWPS